MRSRLPRVSPRVVVTFRPAYTGVVIVSDAERMQPIPQFTAELRFHFRGAGDDASRRFAFGNDLLRRVPMQMRAVAGMHTVELRVDQPAVLAAGNTISVSCRLLAPGLFADVIHPGAEFELWHDGFVATGIVLDRVDEGWANAI